MPPPAGPKAKRRRLTENTIPCIPHGYLVVLPKPLESSRLSRELNSAQFSVQNGSRKRRPQTLAPLSVTGVPTHRPLHAVCGKEDGQILHSAERLDRSSSAQLGLKTTMSKMISLTLPFFINRHSPCFCHGFLPEPIHCLKIFPRPIGPCRFRENGRPSPSCCRKCSA